VRLVTTWFGSFLLDDDAKVVTANPFPKDAEAIAGRLARVEEWKVLDEERALLDAHDELFVHEPRLERAGGNFTREPAPFLKPEDFGFDRALLHDAMLALARRQMRKAVGPDDYASQSVAALDDLQETSNRLLERLREWYGLHYPELAKSVDVGEFLDLVAQYGDRERMPAPVESVGGEISEGDRTAIMEFAALSRDVVRRRHAMEAHLAVTMKELAPNLTHLAGPILAARLISLAGGLEPLARLPAGTVQTLGTRPPKHGVLFQHPWIHRAPRWQRGALSRIFAGKLAMAARADAYSKRFIGDMLKANVEKAMAEAKRKRSEAPPRRPAPQRRRRTTRR
jgi:nucleolar protein 56